MLLGMGDGAVRRGGGPRAVLVVAPGWAWGTWRYRKAAGEIAAGLAIER